jgi:hypothetical protein
LTIFLFVSPVFAEDTQISDVTSSNAIGVTIPSQTDNPSITITFTDPSKDQQGIQLDTDTKGFAQITSPYTFPALSIGKHTLEFKYVDSDGATQLYDSSIIIIPRAPVLTSTTINSDNVTISGTGLASSELIMIVSGGSDVITNTTNINSDGEWTISIARDQFKEEVYSINAYVRRYGYASDLSETTKFTFQNTTTSNTQTKTSFSISEITWSNISTFANNHKESILAALVALIIGIVLGILFTHRNEKIHEDQIVKKVAKEFVKTTPENTNLTLREKLLGSQQEKPVPVEEKTEEEKVMSKIDFLKDFKKFDPDDDKGKEMKPEIEVSLTSKKKDS